MPDLEGESKAAIFKGDLVKVSLFTTVRHIDGAGFYYCMINGNEMRLTRSEIQLATKLRPVSNG